MANLGDLKARIISETLRDDLADDMADQFTVLIQKSIDHYAAMRWWFNEATATITTTAAVGDVTLPADFRFLDQAYLQVGSTRTILRDRQAEEIADLRALGPTNGQPTDFAIYQTFMSLYPTPNLAYPIVLLYVRDVQPPLDYASAVSQNFWTNQGSDLIVARVKLRLYRDYLSATLQDSRVVSANNQEEEAYSRLRSEHNRRLSTNRIRAGW